jgi:hypothetical protein
MSWYIRNAPDLHFTRVRLKSWSVYRLSRFHGLSQTFLANSVTLTRLGHNLFLPNPFLSICHPIIRHYIVYVTESIKK